MICPGNQLRTMCLVGFLLAVSPVRAVSGTSWSGVLTDSAGHPVRETVVKLRSVSGHEYTATTAANGRFAFSGIAGGVYAVSVRIADQASTTATEVVIKDATALIMALQLSLKDGNCGPCRPTGKAPRGRAAENIFPARKYRLSHSMPATSASCFCWRREP
jgi:hypothetical protein